MVWPSPPLPSRFKCVFISRVAFLNLSKRPRELFILFYMCIIFTGLLDGDNTPLEHFPNSTPGYKSEDSAREGLCTLTAYLAMFLYLISQEVRGLSYMWIDGALIATQRGFQKSKHLKWLRAILHDKITDSYFISMITKVCIFPQMSNCVSKLEISMLCLQPQIIAGNTFLI